MRLWPRKKPTDLKLLEPLGEGLTSQVYKAIRKHDEWGVEQIVAVKILNSSKAVHTLKNEIDILMRIESLHCVRCLGWADLERGPALVLEFLDGVSLFELCAYENISATVAEEIVAQLQLGLRDLHSYRIGHGDLSAKNIFVTSRGVVKILDFGFSGAAREGELFGTPQFLAIEGWRGEPLTLRADLFSLGLLRADLLAKSVLQHGTKERWRRRAHEVCGLNPLLNLLAEEREFLPLTSNSQIKAELARLVQRVQEKKKALQSTTRALTTPIVRTLTRPPKWFPTASFCAVFFFFHNLQTSAQGVAPAILPTADLSLDVRSRSWARVQLFSEHGSSREPMGPSRYTPVKFRHLPIGDYEIRWLSRGHSGVTTIHLTENHRHLLRE